MQKIYAEKALLADGWREKVCIDVNTDGRVNTVTQYADECVNTLERGSDAAVTSVDVLLPAISNLHSHAFQRALAGLIEAPAPKENNAGAADDDFWSWRAAMYQIMDRLIPEHVEAITALVQMEMMEAGYGAVGEFHYTHHDVGGAAYVNPAEMSARVVAAAKRTGLGLTHLPVLYMRGGVSDEPLESAQLRFGCDEARFAKLYEGARQAIAGAPADFALGIAPHSLRAVNQEGLAFAADLAGAGPVHIHIAEQMREVEAVKAAYGARPVEWLLYNADVNERWCLVHATHMTPEETQGAARSGSVAGICPLTEANLGDGIFDGPRYLNTGGAYGVGSDSNFRISVSEELRMLEYSQRLRDQRRLVLAEDGKSVGRTLYEGAARGGAQALGRASGAIAPGMFADLVALNGDSEFLCGKEGDAILDGWIFAGDDRLVTDVWSAGRHMVTGGRHVAREEIVAEYRQALGELMV